VPDGAPVLALGPTANWLGKQWPAANFSELARRLTDAGGALSGARVAIFGAPNERATAGELIEDLPSSRVIDLVGTEDLLTVAACLQRANLFVGNDSGLMHMAAAVGTRTVGLFGPSREEHYAPWGVQCAVVRTPESYDDLIGAPGYDHRTTGSLMGSLSVEAALAAAVGLIQRESAAIS
jgi:ADP-heptose:LPS heptosyltransferase